MIGTEQLGFGESLLFRLGSLKIDLLRGHKKRKKIYDVQFDSGDYDITRTKLDYSFGISVELSQANPFLVVYERDEKPPIADPNRLIIITAGNLPVHLRIHGQKNHGYIYGNRKCPRELVDIVKEKEARLMERLQTQE